MTNFCVNCACINKMNSVMKVIGITFIAMIIGALLYFILPQVLPSNFFILFVMLPVAFLGLLFGLALGGFAYGTTKICEWLKK